jgi:hypothetical protein
MRVVEHLLGHLFLLRLELGEGLELDSGSSSSGPRPFFPKMSSSVEAPRAIASLRITSRVGCEGAGLVAMDLDDRPLDEGRQGPVA